MKIEKTEILITLADSLQLKDGRAVRGYFGNSYRNRPEFHGHNENGFIYKHSLIQYKVFGGSALVVGLKEGAYLLKAIPTLEYIKIHHKQCPVVKQNISTDVISFGLTGNTCRYSFATPWIGLNEDNYKKYLTMHKKPKDANALLCRILIGNILSMSKSVSYVVEDKVQMRVDLLESETIEVKKGIEMISFRGEFETNFLIPDFWGIGKFSSRGYGTVKCIDGGEAL